MIRECDVNGNGVIDYIDFVNMMFEDKKEKIEE